MRITLGFWGQETNISWDRNFGEKYFRRNFFLGSQNFFPFKRAASALKLLISFRGLLIYQAFHLNPSGTCSSRGLQNHPWMPKRHQRDIFTSQNCLIFLAKSPHHMKFIWAANYGLNNVIKGELQKMDRYSLLTTDSEKLSRKLSRKFPRQLFPAPPTSALTSKFLQHVSSAALNAPNKLGGMKPKICSENRFSRNERDIRVTSLLGYLCNFHQEVLYLPKPLKTCIRGRSRS